jgi:hypothetical protein
MVIIREKVYSLLYMSLSTCIFMIYCFSQYRRLCTKNGILSKLDYTHLCMSLNTNIQYPKIMKDSS